MADVVSTPGLAAELISAKVQRELAFASKLRNYITDVSSFAEKGKDTISFPKLSSFTVVDRAVGVAGDATALTDTKDSLLLDKNAYVAWIIDSMSSVQTSINAQLENAGRASAAQGRYVDTQIIAQAETDGEAITTVSPLVTRDVILEMQEDLLLRDANLDNVSFWINPTQRTALLKIAEFTRADAYGSSNIPGGVVGSVFGVPVIMHNGLGAAQYFMVEKEGMAIGFQKGLAMDEQGANEFGVGAKRAAMDQLFGLKGLQIGQSGATASALIAKDNN
jgi:hypothetical protein